MKEIEAWETDYIMIKQLRNILDRILELAEKNKYVGFFYPLIEAADTFFFGLSTTTQSAPHIRDHLNLKRYMITVVMALMPLLGAGIYFYGWQVFGLVIISYVFGLGTEILFCMVRKHKINEGAFVTCMIYPLILPPNIPYWMAAVGIVVGIFFGKEVFGGTGKNIFNPAMVGRIFIAVAFPVEMTSKWAVPIVDRLGGLTHWASDVVSSATPLITHKASGALTEITQLLIGTIPGCVGETAKILVIITGLFLVFTRVANWRIPLAYLGSFTVMSIIGNLWAPETFSVTWFQLLTGGLLFGAFFMATDPVSCPFTKEGKWIFGVGLGILTLLIRTFSGYVEGVMFAIIFMNIFAPLIDEIILSKKYKKIEGTMHI